MGRGGRVIYKKPAGRKRRKVTFDGGDDSEDEEYIAAEEEEDDESFYESDASEEERLDVKEDSSTETPEEVSDAELKWRRGFSSLRRGSRVFDYDEEEDEEDNYVDDEDFSPDADEEEEEDWEGDLLVSGNSSGSARQGSLKRGGKKRKRKVAKPRAKRRSMKAASSPGKRRRRVGACPGKEEFVVKGRVAVEMHQKETKKVSKRKVKSKLGRKRRSLIKSESLDSDYLTSDDDFVVRDWVVVDGRRKNTQVRKNANFRKRKKRSMMDSGTSDSDFVIPDEDFVGRDPAVVARRRKAGASRKQFSVESKSHDFNDEISENEIRDLEIEKVFNVLKPERSCAEKKPEDKGKEKEADDLGKQFCGICLSEQQKGTIQGILNCCSHFFCLACIIEWSKVESRCPLCKRRFVTITQSSRSDPKFGMRRTVIRVQKRDQIYQPTEEELRVLFDPYENVVCLECQQGGDDSLMLLCDICDSSAHTFCVGLGREVPEGNWYCDCCRPAGEGSLHSQVHDAQIASSSHVSHGSSEINNSRNLLNSTNFQRLVSFREQSSSSQGFDLNVSPSNVMADDNGVASVPLASGAGASTLFGRRAIRQRIRFLLSSSGPRQLHDDLNREESNLHAQEVVPVPNSDKLHVSEKSNPICQVSTSGQENSRHRSHSTSNSAPCMLNEDSNFRHVEGAKKQVQSMVKHYLQVLSQGIPLERSSFKKIARKATHTILASCGIQHRRSMVSPHPFQPPNSCFHDLDGGPANLVRGCCSSCFTGYVKTAVKMFV